MWVRLAAISGTVHLAQVKPLICVCLVLWPWLVGAAELPAAKHGFTVIAHRGNHARAHENTLTALQAAIEAGVDFAEIDLRRTADGQYVLMHDATVDRMTDGHGAVKDLSFDQIRALHVRDLKRPEIPPDRVPSLPEVLTLIKGRLNIYLDFKAGERSFVAQAIRDAGVTNQILVYDELESLPEWHRVAPELPCIISPPDKAMARKQIVDFALEHHIEVLDGSWQDYSAAAVAAATRAGIKIWPDIQSSLEDENYFAKVLKRGFSGVQTDHPEALIKWLKERGSR